MSTEDATSVYHLPSSLRCDGPDDIMVIRGGGFAFPEEWWLEEGRIIFRRAVGPEENCAVIGFTIQGEPAVVWLTHDLAHGRRGRPRQKTWAGWCLRRHCPVRKTDLHPRLPVAAAPRALPDKIQKNTEAARIARFAMEYIAVVSDIVTDLHVPEHDARRFDHAEAALFDVLGLPWMDAPDAGGKQDG